MFAIAAFYRFHAVEDPEALQSRLLGVAAEDGVKGVSLFEQHYHDVILTDLVMPGMGGMDLLKRIKALQPDTTVVIITAHGSVDRAVEAMREGASDFIAKPFSMAQLLVRLSNVCSVRLLREQNVRLQEQLEQRHSFSNIIGRSKPMQEVFELIRLVSDSDPQDVKRHLMLMQGVKRLTLPAEMGERFKVLGLSRGIESQLIGFSLHDMRGRL